LNRPAVYDADCSVVAGPAREPVDPLIALRYESRARRGDGAFRDGAIRRAPGLEAK
jgi:hypothetical protein